MAEEILNLEPVSYLHTAYPFHFIVIGVGGTGSELIPRLCRQLSLRRNLENHDLIHSITICDADIVEEKNLVRQNFFPSDLGKNKADILGLKCSTVFDIPVNVFPEYIETTDVLHNLVCLHPLLCPFIVGCVDNNATRALIHEYIHSYYGDEKEIFQKTSPTIFYLDSGNEEFAGQVALGVKYRKTNRRTSPPPTPEPGCSLFELPDVADHHPEILNPENKFTSQLSCAEQAESNPQAAATNLEAANILFQMISNCLHGKIDYHYVSFDAQKSTRRVVFNTQSTLDGYKTSASENKNKNHAVAEATIASVGGSCITPPRYAGFAYNPNYRQGSDERFVLQPRELIPVWGRLPLQDTQQTVTECEAVFSEE